MPPRPAASRPGPDGRAEHRAPLPMVQLSYLVSAWAGSTRDEHQLLGDVLTRLVAQQVLPVEHLAAPLESSVQLSLAVDELNRPLGDRRVVAEIDRDVLAEGEAGQDQRKQECD